MPRVAPWEVALPPDRARGRREWVAVAADRRRRVGELDVLPRRRRVSGLGGRPRSARRGVAVGVVGRCACSCSSTPAPLARRSCRSKRSSSPQESAEVAARTAVTIEACLPRRAAHDLCQGRVL